MKNRILDMVKQHGSAKIDVNSLNDIFPSPKRPTIEEMETAIISIVFSPLVEDRGKIAHVFQPSQKEQIEKFIKDNGLTCYDNHADRTIIFGLNKTKLNWKQNAF